MRWLSPRRVVSPVEPAALVLHLAGELPGPADHLADAPHPLAVGAEHRDRADVVQHVLRRHRPLADAALREGHVLRHGRVQVVADHDHVQVLVEGVDRVGVGRVRRRREAVRLAGAADDVGRVPAARALRVIHVDGPAGDRLQRVLEEAALVERVGVQLDLEVELVRDAQAAVDRRRRRAPVLVDLEPEAAGLDLLDQRRRAGGVAAAEEAEVHRPGLRRLQHLARR